jgi:hypothetical protein
MSLYEQNGDYDEKCDLKRAGDAGNARNEASAKPLEGLVCGVVYVEFFAEVDRVGIGVVVGLGYYVQVLHVYVRVAGEHDLEYESDKGDL